ncbi:MAG: GatB/YqeY domain-containing protein [Parvibaculaceae bacterium]|nr:GatB/YqeY domain-containing protein [Parvibaculaceae bacterium]
MMRDEINAAMKAAMKSQSKRRLSTLRLVQAAIKDRDIAARTDGRDAGIPDSEILDVLAKMIKQRQDSARMYEEGGRAELAEAEREEIGIIQEFLPRQLSDDEVKKAVADAVAALGATSLKDMGKVMAELKSRHAGQMDFGKAGPVVKGLLGG